MTLDRDLERILRETAVRTHRPFKKVLNDTLRAGLEVQTKADRQEQFVVRARPMGLRPGHDPAGLNHLADDLEAEAFLEVTGKLLKRGS